MTTTDQRRETVVGAFVWAGAASFVGYLLFSMWGHGLLERTHHYALVLEEGVGLSPGVDVTIAGMEVGRVESVRLTEDRRVFLELTVRSEYAHHVRTDSVGEASMTLAGKVVRIGAGTPEAPPLPDGGQLVSGHNFDVLHALEKMDLVHNLERLEAILVDLDDLAKQLRLGDGRIPEAMDAMMVLVGDLQAGKGTIGKLLQDEATLDEVRAAVASVDEMAAKVEAAAIAMERSTAGIDGAATAVVDASAGIGRASQALATTAESVDTSAERLADSLGKLDEGLVALKGTLEAIERVWFVRSAARKVEEEEGAAVQTP